MMVESRFLLLLLIFGSIFREGNCQEFSEDFKKVVLRAACNLECVDEPCLTSCTMTPRTFVELDEEAGANVWLVCRERTFLVLAHDSGLFVFEVLEGFFFSGKPFQPRYDIPSHHPFVSNGAELTVSSLSPKFQYGFRYRRITADGVSEPAYSKIFYEWRDRNPSVTNIGTRIIGSLHSRNASHYHVWNLEISFSAIDEPRCYYEVTCQQDDGHYDKSIQLVESKKLSVTFTDLPFGAKFTVGISVLADFPSGTSFIPIPEAIRTVGTPRCLGSSAHVEKCFLEPVGGLDVTASHKVNNTFDIHVTWDKPKVNPDYYIVSMTSNNSSETNIPGFHNVSGAANGIIFSDVEISKPFNVHVTSWSSARAGPETSKRIESLEKPIQGEGNVWQPDILNLICLVGVILVVIGIAVYGYYRLRQERLHRNISHLEPGYTEKKSFTEATDYLVVNLGRIVQEKICRNDSLRINNKSSQVDEYEMSPDRLDIKRVLGNGAFGVVKFGTLRDDQNHVTNVAVKMLRDDSSQVDHQNFLLEIKFMKSLDKHPNIVSLLGCCTTGPFPFLVLEYCSRGDLYSFLRKSAQVEETVSADETTERNVNSRRSSTVGEILQKNSSDASTSRSTRDYIQVTSFIGDRDATCSTEIVTVIDMLNFGRQIATGMEFLSSKKVVHRDLATRNVLVCSDRTSKVSDFGLSRNIYLDNVYKKRGNDRMPLKWMAIEALTHQVYTTYSDVWSFGVLLWEIVTLGGNPYPGIPTIEILKQLQSGYRMERPEDCSVSLYNLMMSCWRTKTTDRPTFTTLRQALDKLICFAADTEYLDLLDDLDGHEEVLGLHQTSSPPEVPQRL